MKYETFTLEPSSIDTISDLIYEEMTQLQIAKSEIIRLRFSVEDGLLTWMDTLGAGAPCSIRYGKRYNTFHCTIVCKGQMCNPLAQADDMNGIDGIGNNFNILSQLNLAPAYRYHNGANSLVFKRNIKKSKVPLGIVFAILGAILSVLTFQYAPAGVGKFVLEYITYPMQSLLMNGISMVTGPMLFLAVLTGIMQTGSIQTIRQRGGVMLSSFTAQMIFAAILTVLFCFLGFQYQWAPSTDSGSGVSVFLDMVVDIVPTTIFSPFTDGNALQLVFLSIVSGIALLLAREKTEGLCNLADQAYQFFSVMMEWIAALIPLFIYCTLVNTFMENQDIQVVNILFLICAVFVLMGLFVLIFFVRVVHVCKISPRTLFQKLLPSWLITLAAASTTATFWYTKETCVDKLGIQEDCVNSALPLGSVLYMPAVVIFFTASALYSTAYYGTGVSIQFFLMLIFLGVIMVMAMPPIAGSEIMCLSGLFMGLGIDSTGISLIVALTVMVNGFLAAFGVVSLELTLILCANKLKELDMDILKQVVPSDKKSVAK